MTYKQKLKRLISGLPPAFRDEVRTADDRATEIIKERL
jgi:hypothetical protein